MTQSQHFECKYLWSADDCDVQFARPCCLSLDQCSQKPDPTALFLFVCFE